MPVSGLISPEFYKCEFEVVMMGDVIEHLKKSEGIDLLNFLVYRSRWIIIQFPHKFRQNSIDDHISEAHISVWSEEDFHGFDRTKIYKKGSQRLVVLRGYLEADISIKQIENIVL